MSVRMSWIKAAACLMLSLPLAAFGQAPPVIPQTGDIRVIGGWEGGDVLKHRALVLAAINRKQNVIIDDACISSCTFWLMVPSEFLCATDVAVFLFHQARNEDGSRNERGSRYMLKAYPENVKRQIAKLGGLRKDYIRIKATDVIRRCQ